jgi:hypothetical protein
MNLLEETKLIEESSRIQLERHLSQRIEYHRAISYNAGLQADNETLSEHGQIIRGLELQYFSAFKRYYVSPEVLRDTGRKT